MTQDSKKPQQDIPHSPPTASPETGSVGARLRGYFLAGLLVTAPISITIYLTWAFLTFIEDQVRGLIPPEFYPQTTLPGIGLIIAVVFFILVGWLTRNYFGRVVIRMSEYVLGRMPVIRTIYGALKQIFETIMTSQSQAFREVVMMEYPRRGIWSMGFVTGKAKGEVQRLTEDEVINVFIPTTPNPTSGFLLFIPKKDLHFMDMKVDEAIKLIVSGGIISPPDRADAKVENILKTGPEAE